MIEVRLEATCQRCHESVSEDGRYCAACGLPQLRYVAAETPVIPLEDGPAADGLGMGGVELLGTKGAVAWRPALRSALILAIPAGLLVSSLTPILAIVWVMGAAAWAVVLYSRKIRSGGLSMGVGARIGLVTGLMASWLTCGVNGIALWVSRSMLHEGGQMDSLWQAAVEKNFDQQQQMIVQMGMATAQSAEMAQSMRAMMLSAEGRAGFALLGLVTIAGLLVVFATIGGAVGARFLAQPRRPGA